ncbi:PREDICTED: nucleic-acid-binding protein from mobile element jockey-like isoform X1 [Dinoponera quadriceps]|uniref:Nucleic-acid-binding protein from mobile element jockey-like isoform X1 n=1 Tax=Dinoponera quadriceps TaxID=609295 RepID=A0A6P3X3Y2_DINQU|nr:PREDICTED: nucleic-acid-binding protein from mobile element jockey-like isoform X1 [Dinoponera quadriceps]
MTKAKKSSNQPNLNSQGRKKITQFNDAETSQSSTPDAILQESLSLKKEIAELKCIIQNLEKEQQNIKNEQSSVEQRTHPTPRPEKYTARDETTQTSETDDMQLAEEEDPFIEKLKYENIRKRKTDSREHETAQDTGGKRSSTQKTYNKTASSPESADRQISAQREVTTPKLHMKTKPPSINIMYQDPKDTIELLKSKLNIEHFSIKRISNNKHLALLENTNDFTKTKELLTKTNTNYYTYTAKSNKNHTYLLKGINQSYTEEEILSELHRHNYENIKFIKASRFSTKRSIQNKIILPIFLVTIEANSNLDMLKEIKYIDYNVIHWERLKKKETIQCKKCQRIGHAAINCNMSYRCVKCKSNHDPDKCDSIIKKTLKIPVLVRSLQSSSVGHVFKKESKCHRQRPYHAENTSSRPITAVKQRWARLVLGWVTTWEHRMMLSSFFFISLSIFK